MGHALSLSQRVAYKAGSLLPLGRRRARLARGVLSVTFDDFPRSAWLAGGELLAEVGGRGTYYLAGRFLGGAVDGVPYVEEGDVAALAAAGHELGCHGFDHRSVLESGVGAYVESVRRNALTVEGLLPGHALRSHAFPYGHVAVGARLALRGRFDTLRGIEAPRTLRRFDPTLLRAAGLEELRGDTIDWPRLLARAARTRGWLVLFTHGVTDDPTPYDVRPAVLRGILRAARAEGLDLLPVGEVARRP